MTKASSISMVQASVEASALQDALGGHHEQRHQGRDHHQDD